jgi:hypothetical protein
LIPTIEIDGIRMGLIPSIRRWPKGGEATPSEEKWRDCAGWWLGEDIRELIEGIGGVAEHGTFILARIGAGLRAQLFKPLGFLAYRAGTMRLGVKTC